MRSLNVEYQLLFKKKIVAVCSDKTILNASAAFNFNQSSIHENILPSKSRFQSFRLHMGHSCFPGWFQYCSFIKHQHTVPILLIIW